MRALLIVVGLSAAAFVWTGVAAQQEMLPRPGPGSGITRVEGTVNIGGGSVQIANVPTVRASQEGDWRLAVAPLPFLKVNTRYLITWPDGGSERLSVADVGPGGWIMVVDTTPRRWVNLSVARAVEELR